MAYTTINKSSDYFNTKIYDGTGSSTTVTGVGFQPDFFWIKQRNGTNGHLLWDITRGGNYYLASSSTAGQANDIGTFTAASDGYSLATDTAFNGSGSNYVGWNWKANGSGSANTDGSISATVSANTTAGFSVIKYTGNNTNGATVGHGLGVIPSMVIVKRISSARDWMIKHKDLPSNYNVALNTNDAQWQPSSNGWISDLTSNQTISFSIGSSDIDNVNQGSQQYIAYAFAEKTGYSKFGKYTGNGNSDGPFVYTGFKPAFVICKKSSSTGDWELYDNKRNGFNGTTTNGGNVRVYPNANDVEGGTGRLSLLSNGFKITNSSGNLNNSGDTFIYMAFAEAPLVGTNGVTAKAR